MTLVLLGCVGTGAYIWRKRKHRGPAAPGAPSEPAAKAPPAAQPGEKPRARTILQVRTLDVVDYAGRDWLVEGVVQLDGEGRRRRLARLVDGQEVRWLLVDRDELILLETAAEGAGPLPPPETLLLGGERFTLRETGSARVSRHGDVGPRAAEKCRFWKYVGPGAQRAWLDEFKQPELLVGEALAEGMLDFLPGS